MGVKGRMWHVTKKIYESSKSVVLFEGEKSDVFKVEQGKIQGCSLSPILFSVFINDLLIAVEQTEVGILYIGIHISKESLQKLIGIVYSYCSK